MIGVTLDAEPAGGWSKLPWYALRQNYFAAVIAAGGVVYVADLGTGTISAIGPHVPSPSASRSVVDASPMSDVGIPSAPRTSFFCAETVKPSARAPPADAHPTETTVIAPLTAAG
jgi:putative glutamine amidotransferase